MSDEDPPLVGLQALREALLGRNVGNLVSADDLRVEMAAAGVTGNALGTLFAHAVRRGWLEVIRSEPSKHKSRKGGRILVYRRRPIGKQGRGLHRDRRQPPLPLEELRPT